MLFPWKQDTEDMKFINRTNHLALLVQNYSDTAYERSQGKEVTSNNIWVSFVETMDAVNFPMPLTEVVNIQPEE